MGIIEIKNFSKYYGKFLAVDNINISVNKGEIVGFVGKNGAGKSTTIRAMMNIIFPSSGNISLKGLDSIKYTKKIKNFTSYIPSEAYFAENLKAIDLFKFCLKFSDASMDKVIELSTYFELDLNKKIADLSLGNRKKVSIIQALLRNSEIIILDEPTVGLDPLMQNKFFDLILKEKEKGSTVFLSSHNLVDVENYCDKVIIIKDGKIVDYLDMENVKIKHNQIITFTTKSGKKRQYEFNGNINHLLKELTMLELESLEIKNKSVSEEFIHYYKNDSDQKDGE